MGKFKSRRWLLAIFFSLSTTVGLYYGHIDDDSYVLVVGLILGLYNGVSAYEKVNKGVGGID